MARILLVIDCLGSGGAQRQLVSIAKQMVKRGHHIDLFSYFPQLNHFEQDAKSAGISIYYSSKNHRFSIKPVLQLSSLMAKHQYSGMLAFLRNPAIYMEWGYRLARIRGAAKSTLVFSERLNYFDKEKQSFTFKLAQQNHRICDHIVTNNHFQHREMVQCFPWMKPKLTTIYNGLGVKRSKQVKSNNNSSLRLLAVARVVDYKNYENLALALVHYKNSWGTPPKVDWVGKIFQHGNNLAVFERVRRLLEEHDLQQHLIFHGETQVVEKFYLQADALIHPSKIEGFSNVVIEASEYQLPLLLGNIGDQPSVMEQFKPGVLFDVNDPVDIANAIKTFVDASVEQKAAWRAGSKLAREQLFDINQATESYLKLLLGREINE